MVEKCHFCCKYPPFACKCQIAAIHIGSGDVLSAANLLDVFIEPRSKRPLAFGCAFGCFPDINQPIAVVECINPAFRRTGTFLKWNQWAFFELVNYLIADATV